MKNFEKPAKADGESGKESALKKGILFIFFANALSLVVSLVSGFFLPRFLSVPSYAELKSFQLYISYIGVLHFGYLDGIYIRFGGKNMRDILRPDMDRMRTNIFVLQAGLSVLFACVGIMLKNAAVLVFALCLIPENVSTLYKNLFQATGEYTRYSRVLNVRSVITLLSYVILLFVVKTDNYIWYTLVYLLNMLVIWLYTEIDMRTRFKFGFRPQLSLSSFKADTRTGIVLMLGNFAVILLTGIDRWFVKFLFAKEYFAYYSFAVNIQTMLNTFIIPISTTLYNYLCRITDIMKIKRIKEMCLSFGLYLISSAFIIRLIVENFIGKYILSLNVLFLLFASQLLYLLIQSVYVNIYKARKMQSRYLKQLVIVLALGVVYNIIFYIIMRSMEGIAIGTLLSVISWYVICLKSVPELNFGWKHNITLIAGLAAFLAAGYLLPARLGFAAYIVFITVISLIFTKESLAATLRTGLDMVFGKFKRSKGV